MNRLLFQWTHPGGCAGQLDYARPCLPVKAKLRDDKRHDESLFTP